MSSHPVEKHIIRTEGPMGVARSCRLCKFHHFRRKGLGGGRGNGMREGNKQRGILIQHIKAEHPVEYAAAMAASKEVRDV